MPELGVEIITGVSAGAINAAFLANHAGSFGAATRDLASLWSALRVDDVLRSTPLEVAGNVARWGTQLLSGGLSSLPRVRGLVDTAPLRALLDRVLSSPSGDLPGVARRLAEGRLGALAVTTTSYATGHSMTFAELAPEREPVAWMRPYRVGFTARIRLDHVMASAAIPLLFPAVEIDGSWHGDGSVRQAAPLSPALHLGAERILVVSTVRGPSDPPSHASGSQPYPSLARVLGVTLNSLLYGHTDYDVAQLRRITRLLRSSAEPSSTELRPVEVHVIRPAEDLGEIAADYEANLPRSLRFLTRGLGTRDANSTDLLSTLLFDSSYTERLIECGRRDAERQIEELLAFVGGGGGGPSAPAP
jgi:NTE family protein